MAHFPWKIIQTHFQLPCSTRGSENFRKYLYEGYSLLIKGIVGENSWKNQPELEFKIKSIYLLSSVREELVKNIQIKMPLDAITDEFLEGFEGYVQQGGGSANLKILVYDPVDNVSIDLFCRSQRVVLSDELISFLAQSSEMEFKLY